jgi:peptide subunit release factor 1 (eRF1)
MSLGIYDTIHRLKAHTASPSPILSVYFKLPAPKRVDNTTIVNKLQTVINTSLSFEQREEVKKNIAYILGFMEKYQQSHNEKTIVFFCGGDNLFEVLHLPFAIKNLAVYSHTPYLQPLLEGQEDTRRYFVILSDREKAIFYTVFGGKLEDQKVVLDDSVPQDVKGRWPETPRANRQDKVQRHIQYHLNHHFSYLAQKAAEFVEKKPISGVILGGHKNEMGKFEKYLPKQLKEKVVGRFVSELKTNFNDILAKSQRVVEKANKSISHQVYPFPM